jgi:GntR family transcriptional regulator/MocR family aminotransferase
MEFHVSLAGRRDLSGQIYRQMKQAILLGTLREGDRLPSTRDLARGLIVSRAIVTTAYDRLAAEGLVTSRVGAGAFVGGHLSARASRQKDRPKPGALEPQAVWSSIKIPRVFDPRTQFDFRTGSPDASLFPYRAWRRLLADQMRVEAEDGSIYSHPAGLPALQQAIARHIAISRGVQTSPEDIVITNGTQQALDVIARAVLAPKDRVAVEDPGYPPPRALFRSLGLTVQPIGLDREGLLVGALPPSTRLVYVTPSHHYPLGMSMSLERRLALLEWAEENNAAIIEDDYDSEFRFAGRPIEPLQTLDSTGRVIYVGSFSKTLLPRLRLGFVVTPPSLRDAMQKAKYVSDWYTSTAFQGALAAFIDSGMFVRHIGKMRSVYEKRNALIRRLIARDFSEELEVLPSRAGLHITALAKTASYERIDAVIRQAGQLGIVVHNLAATSDKRIAPGIMLGYGAIATGRIEEALSRLRRCFDYAATPPGAALEKAAGGRY